MKVSGPLQPAQQDIPFMEKRACAVCQIQWYSPKDRPTKECPLCAAMDVIQQQTTQIHELRTDVEMAMQNTERLSVQVNELDAMRKALTVISTDDMAFIKSVCYRWKDDEASFNLVATQGVDDRWMFLVRHRKRGNNQVAEEHFCTSMGGIALASSYLQAVKVSGHNQAMRMLIRSLSQHLAQVEG